MRHFHTHPVYTGHAAVFEHDEPMTETTMIPLEALHRRSHVLCFNTSLSLHHPPPPPEWPTRSRETSPRVWLFDQSSHLSETGRTLYVSEMQMKFSNFYINLAETRWCHPNSYMIVLLLCIFFPLLSPCVSPCVVLENVKPCPVICIRCRTRAIHGCMLSLSCAGLSLPP